MQEQRIPEEYWDPIRRRYNSHAFFNTRRHRHICDYSGEESCDILIVECNDGRWYIEDNWGGDAKGATGVFNPFEKASFPTFYPSMEKAEYRAAEIISSITGADINELLSDD